MTLLSRKILTCSTAIAITVLTMSFTGGDTPSLIRKRITENNRVSEIKTDSVNADVSKILASGTNLNGGRFKKSNSGVTLTIQDIYVKDGMMWFKLSVSNKTAVPYQIDNILFSIGGEGKQRNGSVGSSSTKQISDLISTKVKSWPEPFTPSVTEAVKKVAQQTEEVMVYGFPAYGFSEDEVINIRVWERQGGRNMSLNLSAKMVLDSKASF